MGTGIRKSCKLNYAWDHNVGELITPLRWDSEHILLDLPAENKLLLVVLLIDIVKKSICKIFIFIRSIVNDVLIYSSGETTSGTAEQSHLEAITQLSL